MLSSMILAHVSSYLLFDVSLSHDSFQKKGRSTMAVELLEGKQYISPEQPKYYWNLHRQV